MDQARHSIYTRIIHLKECAIFAILINVFSGTIFSQKMLFNSDYNTLNGIAETDKFKRVSLFYIVKH